jgi:hypothetical protein
MVADAQDQRTDGQHDQSAPAGDDHYEQAARLDRDNPHWLVVWGIFSHEFVAFPLFRVPQGTVLCTRSCPELVRRMRQAEAIYGGSPDV